MWIKRTQKEIDIEFAKRKNSYRKCAIIFWILIIPLAAFLKPKSTIGIGDKYFVSLEEAIDRLWWLIPLFVIGGYLVIPSELPPEITEITFSSRVMQGGKILKELPPKKISEMINTNSSPQDNNFYFINRDPKATNDIDYVFNVTKDSTPLSLAVSIHNPSVRRPLAAYVKVQRGGFK